MVVVVESIVVVVDVDHSRVAIQWTGLLECTQVNEQWLQELEVVLANG